MCYMIARQHGPSEATESTPATPDRTRARWVGAAAAMLIGSVAMAAFVGSSSAPVPKETARTAAGTQPVTTAMQTRPDASRTSLPADDDVPTSTGLANVTLGHCEHGM